MSSNNPWSWDERQVTGEKPYRRSRLGDLDYHPRDKSDLVTTETMISEIGARKERERIRAELIDWLIGDLSRGGWIINGRRIVDEIDRICPID